MTSVPNKDVQFHTYEEYKEFYASKPPAEEFPGKSEHYIAGAEAARLACQKVMQQLDKTSEKPNTTCCSRTQ